MPRTKIKRSPAASVRSDIVVEIDTRREGPEPVLGAAYSMMDRAYALISGNRRKKLKVTLRPKLSRKSADLSALKGAFLAELEAQKLRWAVARNNASVREYVAENALSLAKEYSERTASSSAPAVEELTEAQRSEIERLIEEVETEIAEMNLKKAPESNPAALSWEAAQKPATGGAGA